jgi:hypothetical protein
LSRQSEPAERENNRSAGVPNVPFCPLHVARRRRLDKWIPFGNPTVLGFPPLRAPAPKAFGATRRIRHLWITASQWLVREFPDLSNCLQQTVQSDLTIFDCLSDAAFRDPPSRSIVFLAGAGSSIRAPSSSGTENSAKAFSFLNTRSDFLTVAAVAALLATPSAALGDSVSSASVAALPTRGDDVLEDHGGSILCPRAGHSAPG